jgi:ribosomal protein RSM22 (predicted rRNA methylase)
MNRMRLPEELVAAIQDEVERADQRDLLRASQELTRRYKAAGSCGRAIESDLHRAAYLLVRLPATYAACAHAFSEIRRLAPHAQPASILDLGGGPGTAVFAAAEVFPSLSHAQLMESSPAWLEIGKRLAAKSPHPLLAQARWVQHDLRAGIAFQTHDLVVLSYALGELPQAAAESLIRLAWKSTSQFMVVIEPGTPRGFATVLAARSAFIAAGARIAAPCPHHDACPMAGTRDWCHFAQRVERTSQHRRLKSGALGYEDEKFSYVIAARHDVRPAAARIVRHPKKLSGHVQLILCARHGIETRTVTRSSGDVYKLARQAEWGDAWETGSGSDRALKPVR